MASMADSSRSSWGAAASIVLAIVAASTVFAQLQRTLNYIWRRSGAPATTTWIEAVIDRALAAAMIVVFGLTIIVSSAVAWAGAALGRWATEYLPETQRWLWAIDVATSWAMMTLVIACVFRWLPDVRIGWSHVFAGGVATAGLFLLGKAAVSYYIGFVEVGSAYGAAGSIVVFVVWVYYTSQAFLFGAECTAVWAGLRPIDVRPTTKSKRAALPRI
jgi:membrane protein